MNEVEEALAEMPENEAEIVIVIEPYLERPTRTDRIRRSYVARLARKGVKQIRQLRKKREPKQGYNSLKNWRERNGN